ncbi:50S ribosomal protein L25/general stress protein Ctc [Marinagarivorans algicola]|uniref:50S ribosomal protein L25/general stress protein Ctc n=1 Tax=Marinagarivorans algicola TaxID=1513270 RepID=UPI0006B4F349|nr:50S ribosomal protein L25/general stress protein Ctc [Marinagarivorans algicola]
MSTEDFKVIASSRELSGKGASRRLRREQGLLPAIIYGGDKAPQSVTLVHKDLIKHLDSEAFYSHIITIEVDGTAESVILKDLQRHPAKPVILHADFLRVSADSAITVSVPLHFVNETTSKGVKVGGGIVNHTMTQLDISCLPGQLPEYIEVDLIDVEVGQTVHISDIKLPEGVSSVALSHGADHDLPVASIIKPKGVSDDSDAEEETTEA